MANHCHTHRPAVMIEEEPPHEFYASLCGKSATSSTGALRKKEDRTLSSSAAPVAVPSFPLHDSQHHSFPRHVVPPDEEEDQRDGSSVKGDSEFSRAYRRTLSGPQTNLTSLALDGSNRGYQLLSRMGWKEEGGGLGRNRQGSMLPIKTRVKSDKKGLGRGKKIDARITHHQPTKQQGVPIGTAAAEREATVETKAARRLRAREEANRERRREKRARMLLRTDVSDEYEELYLRLQC